MGRRMVVVDVFAEAPLEGNQLAVVIEAEGLETTAMQRIARETNFSETTFVLPAQGAGDVQVRIFTPGMELPFAGHPTLGTGWVVSQRLTKSEVVLEEGVGEVPVRFLNDGSGFFKHPGARLLPALGDTAAVVECGPRLALFPLASRADVDAVQAPDWSRYPEVDGAYFFALEGAEAYVRMLGAPHTGIVEDPATGSGAGGLAVYLDAKGQMADELTILQGVRLGRPSRISVRHSSGGYEVGGRVQKVFDGELLA